MTERAPAGWRDTAMAAAAAASMLDPFCAQGSYGGGANSVLALQGLSARDWAEGKRRWRAQEGRRAGGAGWQVRLAGASVGVQCSAVKCLCVYVRACVRACVGTAGIVKTGRLRLVKTESKRGGGRLVLQKKKRGFPPDVCTSYKCALVGECARDRGRRAGWRGRIVWKGNSWGCGRENRGRGRAGEGRQWEGTGAVGGDGVMQQGWWLGGGGACLENTDGGRAAMQGGAGVARVLRVGRYMPAPGRSVAAGRRGRRPLGASQRKGAGWQKQRGSRWEKTQFRSIGEAVRRRTRREGVRERHAGACAQMAQTEDRRARRYVRLRSLAGNVGWHAQRPCSPGAGGLGAAGLLLVGRGLPGGCRCTQGSGRSEDCGAGCLTGWLPGLGLAGLVECCCGDS